MTGVNAFINRMTLGKKVLIFSVVIVAISILATFLVITLWDVKYYKRNLQKNIVTSAEIISQNLTAALAFKDYKEGISLISSLKVNDQIAYACVYDAGGEVFAQYPHDNITQDKCSTVTPTDDNGFTIPIAMHLNKLGSLFIQQREPDVGSFLVEQVYPLLFSVGIIVVAVGAFVLLFFQRFFARPVETIIHHVELLTPQLLEQAASNTNQNQLLITAQNMERILGAFQTLRLRLERSQIERANALEERRYFSHAAAGLYANNKLKMDYLRIATARNAMPRHISSERSLEKNVARIKNPLEPEFQFVEVISDLERRSLAGVSLESFLIDECIEKCFRDVFDLNDQVFYQHRQSQNSSRAKIDYVVLKRLFSSVALLFEETACKDLRFYRIETSLRKVAHSAHHCEFRCESSIQNRIALNNKDDLPEFEIEQTELTEMLFIIKSLANMISGGDQNCVKLEISPRRFNLSFILPIESNVI